MARATYIWLVFYGNASKPLAAFTVKHQMVSWLVNSGLTVEKLSVFRYKDAVDLVGRTSEVMKLDIGELLA